MTSTSRASAARVSGDAQSGQAGVGAAAASTIHPTSRRGGAVMPHSNTAVDSATGCHSHSRDSHRDLAATAIILGQTDGGVLG